MSYTVLARKYRSVNFDELVGQEHVASTLKKAISSGRIAHAYLFCGTRGTGKTSTARILAKALNCQAFDKPTPEPCGKCDSCLSIARGEDIDVIEIDAASNTGVDNVREIIENSQYRPSRSRFKIYIIDEVHMLSKSAFNALLKTLEEPPSHVKFILATTEPEKVLPTILSRCQRYDFRSISTREIAGHLKEICRKEKISADEDALLVVAKAGAGSMRDALSLLDRLLSLGEKKLAVKDVEEMLGLPRAQAIFELAEAIGGGDVKGTLEKAEGLISAGLSADGLLAALSDHLRNLLIAVTCGKDSKLVDVPGLSEAELWGQASKFSAVALSQDIAILEELRRNLRQSQTGRAMVDAALVRIVLAEQFSPIGSVTGAGKVAGAGTPVEQKKKPEVMVAMPAPVMPVIAATPVPSEVEERAAQVQPLNGQGGDFWADVLVRLKGTAFSSVLGMARLEGIAEGMAVIRVPASVETFVRQWALNGRRDQLAKILTELRGEATGVRFEVDQNAGPQVPASARMEAEAGPVVEYVLKEFGGTLVEVK